MRRVRSGVTAAALLAVSACGVITVQSDQDVALNKARQACLAWRAIDIPSSPTSAQWQAVWEQMVTPVDAAAGAARSDARWDRLSQAFSDIHTFAHWQVTAVNEEADFDARELAWAEVRDVAQRDPGRALLNECAKATAE